MTKKEITDILYERSEVRTGILDKQEFGVEQGPFENSDCKYVAYLINNYNGDFYFNTVEEFLNGFIINDKPLGKQLDKVKSFSVVKYS